MKLPALAISMIGINFIYSLTADTGYNMSGLITRPNGAGSILSALMKSKVADEKASEAPKKKEAKSVENPKKKDSNPIDKKKDSNLVDKKKDSNTTDKKKDSNPTDKKKDNNPTDKNKNKLLANINSGNFSALSYKNGQSDNMLFSGPIESKYSGLNSNNTKLAGQEPKKGNDKKSAEEMMKEADKKIAEAGQLKKEADKKNKDVTKNSSDKKTKLMSKDANSILSSLDNVKTSEFAEKSNLVMSPDDVNPKVSKMINLIDEKESKLASLESGSKSSKLISEAQNGDLKESKLASLESGSLKDSKLMAESKNGDLKEINLVSKDSKLKVDIKKSALKDNSSHLIKTSEKESKLTNDTNAPNLISDNENNKSISALATNAMLNFKSNNSHLRPHENFMN